MSVSFTYILYLCALLYLYGYYMYFVYCVVYKE
jgi:hypothetical protein